MRNACIALQAMHLFPTPLGSWFNLLPLLTHFIFETKQINETKLILYQKYLSLIVMILAKMAFSYIAYSFFITL
jgi:hypothetical protein